VFDFDLARKKDFCKNLRAKTKFKLDFNFVCDFFFVLVRTHKTLKIYIFNLSDLFLVEKTLDKYKSACFYHRQNDYFPLNEFFYFKKGLSGEECVSIKNTLI
jgi:hypothetical protein